MKKIVMVVCAFIVLCTVACSSRTYKLEIGYAAKNYKGMETDYEIELKFLKDLYEE